MDSKRRREIRLELELSAWTVWEELQPAVGEEHHCLWLWTGALAQGAGDTHPPASLSFRLLLTSWSIHIPEPSWGQRALA